MQYDPVKVKKALLGGWKLTESSWRAQAEGEHNTQLPRLKVVTYNVWFDQESWKKRFNEILRLVKEQDPDVVCFQEGRWLYNTLTCFSEQRVPFCVA
jgi:endonuclease/exonuclease/phosphatase (EEP) superfamily protein YafD